MGSLSLGNVTRMISGAGSWEDIFGKKPVVPELGDSQQKAIAANLSALPSAQQLASEVNTGNQDALLAMLRKAIPGYDEIRKESSENLQAGLKGKLRDDLADEVWRRGATNAIYKGFGGSGMGRNLVARDLGLTSYGITQQALSSSEQWMQVGKSLAVPGQFDVSSMFVSPTQQFERDYAKAKIEAAPDPAARGAFDTEMSWIGMVLSIYGGGAGYTGTYRGQDQPPPREETTGSPYIPTQSFPGIDQSQPITSNGISLDQMRPSQTYNPGGMGW